MRAVVTPTHRRLRASSVDALERDLAALSRLFASAPIPVHLVGGLAMAVRAGHFYRNHRDADVAVFADDLITLAGHLDAHGFALGRQRAYTHGTPTLRLQLVRRLHPSRIGTVDPERVKLRVFPKRAGRITASASRTSYIDVFLLGRTDAGVVLHGYGATVPWDDWYPLTTRGASGSLLLPNIRYRTHLPPRGAKQRLDFALAGLATTPRALAAANVA